MSQGSEVQGRRFCTAKQIFTGIMILTAASAGCTRQQEAAPTPRRQTAVPVVVAKVEQKSVPIELTAIGNVEAYSTVSVRSRVAGQLLEVHFSDGDYVRKGQLLFTIDPRPYQTALAQAQATLERDRAVAANNRVQAERYKRLLAEGVAPQQQVDVAVSTAEASDALVKADEAAVEAAKLNLEYTTIYSPIDGRTGSIMVKPGNLVGAGGEPLVVINQVNPIYVNFTVPQQNLEQVRRYMARGRLPVTAVLSSEPGSPEYGTLTFVDNAVDPATGTIRLKATFSNERNRMWPGLFVNTVLRLSEEANAIVVPAQAITTGQNGQFVYVVKSDGTVESRPIVSSRTIQGEAVIEQGLQAGETVVIDGQLRLVPGARVEITNAPGGSAAPSPGAEDAPRRQT